MKTQFVILSFILLTLPALAATSPKDPTVRCELYYANSNENKVDQRTVTLHLKKEAFEGGVNFTFDQIMTLEEAGRPDLMLWITGNYFRNQVTPQNTYMMMGTFLCEKTPGVQDVKCLSQDSTTTVSAHIVKEKTDYEGKNMIMLRSYLQAQRPSLGMDRYVNYRLRNGHALEFSKTTLEEYNSMFEPRLDVACSVQDDVMGIDGAFAPEKPIQK